MFIPVCAKVKVMFFNIFVFHKFIYFRDLLIVSSMGDSKEAVLARLVPDLGDTQKMMLVTMHIMHTAHCSLLTAHCTLHTAHCALHNTVHSDHSN